MTTATVSIETVAALPLHRRVAANIRAEMGRNAVSQARLGHALGVGQQGVSLRSRGLVPFTLNEIEILAALFGMSPDDLITGVPGPGNGPDEEAAAAVVRRQGLEPRTR